MRRQISAKYVRCPFYRRHSARAIGCEGIAPENVLRLEFGREEDLRRHKRRYCDARWEECAAARAVEAQYARDGEEAAEDPRSIAQARFFAELVQEEIRDSYRY